MSLYRRLLAKSKSMAVSPIAPIVVSLGLIMGLNACGGGDSGATASNTTPDPVVSSSPTSSGVITAFGSVFVNGHEFSTANAKFIDDDTGASSTAATGLEVGMVVDVKPSAQSSSSAPSASELHIHPLARGYVDANDLVAGTLTVMGQVVQLGNSTNFSDHRACVSATTSPCTAITSAQGLSATTTGTSTTAGSYVTVHGYLFGATSGAANIVATLVSVSDVPTSTTAANFKAEGLATISSAGVASIGGLTLDLSKASCYVSGVKKTCASAFTSGQVVSAGAAAAPTLPATTLVADFARQSNKVAVDTAGASVEVEGVVSSKATTSLVVRGMTVDTSGLASSTTLPAVGDVVRVVGTLSTNGQSVTATSATILHSASSIKLGLVGDTSAATAGTAANTYTVTVLGQTVTVNAQTKLADLSTKDWYKKDQTTNPFNITTFATYLAASTSKHVVVAAETDSTGVLVARSFTLVPASNVVGVAGTVDASPTVVNSTATGTPSTFSVHGISISADPAAIVSASSDPKLNITAVTVVGILGGTQSLTSTAATIAAGDQVVVTGTLSGSTVTVSAKRSLSNQVLDLGTKGSSTFILS